MSWSIRLIGTPERLCEWLREGAPGMPAMIRIASIDAIQALVPGQTVMFETSGHIDGASGDFKLEVKSIDALCFADKAFLSSARGGRRET